MCVRAFFRGKAEYFVRRLIFSSCLTLIPYRATLARLQRPHAHACPLPIQSSALVATQLALKLSIMDAPTPYAVKQNKPPAQPDPPPEPPARVPPTSSLAMEASPPASSEPSEVVGSGVTGDPDAAGGVWPAQEGKSLATPAADARVVAHAGGVKDTGWSGSEGASAAQPLVAQPRLQGLSDDIAVEETASTEERYQGDGVVNSQQGQAAAAMPDPEEVEDEAARELRLALEEETRYYESGVHATADDDGGERSGALLLNGPDGAATAVTGRAEGYSLAEHLHPSGAAGDASAEGAVSGEGEGGDEELVRVLEQSRVEEERAKLAKAREEEEEEMVARVMEESRLEQQRRDEEQLDFRRVSVQRLSSMFFLVIGVSYR